MDLNQALPMFPIIYTYRALHRVSTALQIRKFFGFKRKACYPENLSGIARKKEGFG